MVMRVAIFLFSFFAIIVLIAYGHIRWSMRFQARVPMTNTAGVQRAVGRPVKVSTNLDGTVKWNYRRWWTGEGRVYFDTNGNYIRTFIDF
jgi:hypothetical protein